MPMSPVGGPGMPSPFGPPPGQPGPGGPGGPPRPPGPPWPPGYPPWGPYRPPPRKSSNTGILIAVAVVAVLLIGVVGAGVVVAQVADSGTEAGYERYTRITTTTTTSTTTTTTTTSSEEFTPTPTGPQPVPALGDHPINREDLGLPAVACNLGQFSNDVAGQDRFYRAAIDCLDRAWQPLLAAADLPFSSPTLETITGPTSTPCGDRNGGSETAYYCGRNTTIYMSAGHYPQWYGSRMGAYLKTIAHEYGHHVQSISGILGASWDARYEAGPDTPKGQELSRRTELQANCYSGMFFTALQATESISQDTIEEARSRLQESTPQSPTHGTREHYTSWFFQGLEKNRTFQCNTWRSDAGDVT